MLENSTFKMDMCKHHKTKNNIFKLEEKKYKVSQMSLY